MKVRKMTLASLLAALMAVCAWIAIPLPPIAVTMQTFGVLLALGLLGGRWGTVSVLLYLAMGFLGLPVFSGFQGGAGVLLGPSGGFLWGFALGALGFRLTERAGKLPALILCQGICWGCGCLWFARWAGISPAAAALTAVVPYLVPDALKLMLAWRLARRLGRQLRLQTCPPVEKKSS